MNHYTNPASHHGNVFVAPAAGWRLVRSWADKKDWFAVQYYEAGV